MTRFAQILRETAWRTKPAGALRVFNFESHSIQPNNNTLVDEGAGSADPLDHVLGAFTISGSFSTWLYPEVVASIIYAGIGKGSDIQTTGTGPYTHTLKAGLALDSLYMELGYDTTGTRELLGVVLSEINIETVKREKSTVSLSVMGAKEPNGSTLAAAQSVTTLPATPPFVFHEGIPSINAVAQSDIEAASLKINNNLPDDKFCLSDRFGSDVRADLQKREITWGIDARFENATNYNRFIAETEFAFKLDLVKGTNRFLAETPRCILTDFPADVSGRERFLFSLEAKAFYDTSAGHALQLTTINSETNAIFKS